MSMKQLALVHETPRTGRPRVYVNDTAKKRAYRQRVKERQQYPPLPAGPYRVIYADPPWQYFKRDPTFHGHATNHYPTLSIAELCALPVRKLVGPTAVLCLWVTAPLLPECFPVVKAWGFVYKTHIVWDKGKMIHGLYVGNQHELLLICTRGRCRPEVQTLEPSVQRLPPTAHSRKPVEFRLLIDHLYPTGRRLELFAREQAEGWDTWGNAVEMASTP
jgi:N6-adenosine-specific RNA methylase IME4